MSAFPLASADQDLGGTEALPAVASSPGLYNTVYSAAQSMLSPVWDDTGQQLLESHGLTRGRAVWKGGMLIKAPLVHCESSWLLEFPNQESW